MTSPFIIEPGLSLFNTLKIATSQLSAHKSKVIRNKMPYHESHNILRIHFKYHFI